MQSAASPRPGLETFAPFLALVLALCAAGRAQSMTTGTTCTLDALPGLAAQYARAQREMRRFTGARPLGPAMQAAYAADFWQLASSVLGVPPDDIAETGGAPVAGVGLPSLGDLPCDRSVRARDHVVRSMGLVGYSSREIADVVGGHLTRADLDDALKLLMASRPRAQVAAFVEARWRDDVRVATPNPSPSPIERAQPGTIPVGPMLPADLDAALSALAREHRVPANLVRAVIAAESGGSLRAVSSAGAIGLMQLMPLTAAALGVDPWQPLQNLRGGIAYLAGLLRAYNENATLALIAYNAGPQHADRVRAGRAVAYRETRRYLDAINARYPLR